MRVLVLTHSFFPDIGGIEIISEILAKAFTAIGHEVRLVTWSNSDSKTNFRFQVIRTPSVIELCRHHLWANVVFENNPCLRLSWPSLLIKRPIMVSLQTWIHRVNGNVGWQDNLKLKWLSRADCVIACSEAIKKECWPSARLIKNPYDDNLFKNLYIQRDFDFVFLGRLVSDKGADLAIKAIYNLINANRNPGSAKRISLTIIGAGPELKNLENLVLDLQLTNYVRFDGILTGQRLVHRLNQHRFILIPSLWKEPFGVVALEGMACGCIPIVSSEGGLPDAVGNAGLIFRRGDLVDLLRCIQKVINEPETEKQLRNNMKNHLSHHEMKNVSRQYLDIIESIAITK